MGYVLPLLSIPPKTYTFAPRGRLCRCTAATGREWGIICPSLTSASPFSFSEAFASTEKHLWQGRIGKQYQKLFAGGRDTEIVSFVATSHYVNYLAPEIHFPLILFVLKEFVCNVIASLQISK